MIAEVVGGAPQQFDSGFIHQHFDIIGFPEVGGSDQKIDPALFQGITQTRKFVSRIDVYHNSPHQGCGILYQYPFVAVR